MREAADCDVPDGEMTQWRKERRRRDRRDEEKQKSVTMKGLKKSQNNVARRDRKNATGEK